MKLAKADGCSYSEPKVFPSNWKSTRANVKIPWFIHYRFYEVGGATKQVKVKGMNRYSNLKERQAATAGLLTQELEMLKDHAYNPFANQMDKLENDTPDYIISPSTTFVRAMEGAVKEMTAEPTTLRDARGIVKHIATAARQLRLDQKPVSEVERRHLIAVLNQCGVNKKEKWTANNFNVYRANLLMIYKKLIELQTVGMNPVRDILKKKVVVKIRETLTKAERAPIIRYLKGTSCRFWIYSNIFFHSGSRTRELLRLTGKDVDMTNQRFKITVKKGRNSTEEWRPIKDIALTFWQMALLDCKPDDFIFGRGLKPGAVKIGADQITKRWYPIKQLFKITADFYSLKHSNLDETAKVLSIKQAQRAAGHRSERTTRIYTIGQEGRDNDDLKSVYNPL